MVWYSHLFQNFPQFIVIHTVKGFGIVNKAEIDVFLELFCFFDDPADVDNLLSGSSAFSKTSLNIWKFMFHGFRTEWSPLEKGMANQFSILALRMKRQKDRTLKEELPRSVGAQYATGDRWRNNIRKNEVMEPKQKQPSCGCD